MSAVAFLGDECSTLHLTPQLRQLHDVYYEPLAAVQPSLEALLAGEQCRGADGTGLWFLAETAGHCVHAWVWVLVPA